MKIAISNIGWKSIDDQLVYQYLKNKNISGLEIAPTRIIENQPYNHIEQAKENIDIIKRKYGLEVCSMQSIWFGKTERIAQSRENRDNLFEYSKKAIEFANAINCRNLVFGCPKNRRIENEHEREIVNHFMFDLAEEAKKYDVVIALEPNPEIYQTNYINTTKQAIDFVNNLQHPNLMVNLDFGTMIENNESLSVIEGNVDIISHIHISEPFLKPICKRDTHKELFKLLKKEKYKRYISVEMGKCNDTELIFRTIEYVKDIFSQS